MGYVRLWTCFLAYAKLGRFSVNLLIFMNARLAIYWSLKILAASASVWSIRYDIVVNNMWSNYAIDEIKKI